MPVSRSFRWLASTAMASVALSIASLAGAETLSADQAVRRAAAQNPNLKAAILEAKAARLSVEAEENARVPTFVAGVSGEYAESISGPARSDAEAIRGNAGVQFKTDIGTTIETGVQSDVVWRNLTSGADPMGPTYGASAYLTARQPLLRGAGSDVVLAPLAQATSAEEQAELQRQLEASQTALDVLNAYWELWYADRALEVQQRALEVSQKQVADAKTRVEQIGTGSKLDVYQFSSSVANLQGSVAQAKTQRKTRAIQLGRLLAMTPDDAVALEPLKEIPAFGSAPSSAALKAALLGRSKELASARAQIDSAETRVLIADDADKPRVDLFGTVSMGANWQTGDAYRGMDVPGSRPAFSVFAGVEVEVPLGESRATSEAARARVQLDALRERYRARVDAITADVESLAVEIDAAETQIELADEGAEIAEQLAEAERTRLELGTTTSLNVVQAEQGLREAELRRLRARVDQGTKQLALEHDAGALLDRYAAAFAGGKS